MQFKSAARTTSHFCQFFFAGVFQCKRRAIPANKLWPNLYVSFWSFVLWHAIHVHLWCITLSPFCRNSFSYQLTSAAIYPFIALATVSNRQLYLKRLRIKVRKSWYFLRYKEILEFASVHSSWNYLLPILWETSSEWRYAFKS